MDTQENIKNYLQLAETAAKGKNPNEALLYANKVLELDFNNSQAWLTKLEALDSLGTINNHLRLSEYQEAGLKAIETSKGDESIKNLVYAYFVIKAKVAMQFCDTQIRDTDNIQRYLQATRKLDFSHANEKTSNLDNSMITNIDMISRLAVDLKNCVPVEHMKSNSTLQNSVTEIAQLYVSYCQGYNDRLNIYGHHLADSAVEARKRVLSMIQQGLPEEQFKDIEISRINNEQKKEGCYIATAVYGSYDAPEVMVLRYFRDTTLSSSPFGRLFIKTYYHYSPYIAEKLKYSTHINKMVRAILDKWVKHLNDSK